MSDFSSTTTRRARKANRCDECGEGIPAGQRYQYIVGVFEGDFFSHHSCLWCAFIFGLATTYARELGLAYDEGPWLGGLWGWLEEEAHNAGHPSEEDA